MTQKDARIYVGNLPPDIRSKELETMFEKYGKVVKVDVKHGAGRGPPFAFIEYEDHRDAEDAVRLKNGTNYDGYSLRVEVPHASRDGGRGSRGGRGPPRYDDRSRGYYNGGGGGYRGSYDRGYDRSYNRGYDRDRSGGYRDSGYESRDRRRSSTSRRSYKVVVTGFPDSTTQSDLKKHMKDAGNVVSASIRDGTGYVEYDNSEDMRYALKKLDDTDLETEDGDKSAITVKENRSSSGSRSRSRSPVKRRRSSSRSPKRQSRSRSRS